MTLPKIQHRVLDSLQTSETTASSTGVCMRRKMSKSSKKTWIGWLFGLSSGAWSLMHISRKRSPGKPSYVMLGETLEEVTSTQYLGVYQNSLKWDLQTQHAAGKATRALNFLMRNFHNCTKKKKKRKSCITRLLSFTYSMLQLPGILEQEEQRITWESPKESGKIRSLWFPKDI